MATARKQRDSSRQSEARLRAVVDTAVDGIVIIDDRGVIQSFNPACQKLFGYAPAEVIGRNVAMLMPDPDRTNHDGYIRDYLRTGRAKIIGIGREVAGRRKDGSTFPMYLSVGDARSGDERFFVGILRDLTERNNYQRQLGQAQKMEVVGQLTGGVAHDFNNILTVIIGNLELLEASTPKPNQVDLIREALEAANHGAGLTQRLLAFARRQALAPTVIDLNEELLGMSDLLERTLGASIDVSMILDKDLWPALADPAQVESSVLNLAINARDAMPGGGRLTIETANAELDQDYAAARLDVAPGRYVRLAVTDTGAGMSREVAARAFDPFFTTKKASGGTGLGLSTVYGFMKQSGGHAAIYSEPGQGTTVSLFFPQSSTAARSKKRRRTEESQPQGGRETLLVVEDDPRVRQVTVRRLRDLGYTVIEAADGPQALAQLSSGQAVDLLFTDIVMPGGLNGRELAERARYLRPALKLLFTSGYADPQVLRGMKAKLLRKPYSRAELAGAIRAALATR